MVTSTAAPAAASSATTTASQSTGIKADFNLFLKLLTAQLQNQDPLSPLDTAQFTQQLVQYSQVEQSVQQNTTLKDILSNLSGQGLTQASGLIGRTVTLDSDLTGFSTGNPAKWSYAADRKVTSLTTSITDDKGKVVATGNIPPEMSGSFTWDGKQADGTIAPAGTYRLVVTGADAAGAAVPVKVRSEGIVQQVNASGGALTLTVNGASVSVNKVIGVTTTP